MASIRKRGETFTITAYMGYDKDGRQIKKTTTFRPPDGVTAGKAEKLARAYAVTWEEKIKGYVALDENRTLLNWQNGTIHRLRRRYSSLISCKITVVILNGTSCPGWVVKS